MIETIRGKRIRVLISASEIAGRNDALALEIKAAGLENVLVIAILKGSFIFAADLLRSMHGHGLAPDVDFISLSSYGSGEKSTGTVRVQRDVESPIAGRDILLIDDILETGRTTKFARDLMLLRGARRVQTAVLLHKKGKEEAEMAPDFTGFTCPDHFVVGYGMDAAHIFRELPYIGVVEGDA